MNAIPAFKSVKISITTRVRSEHVKVSTIPNIKQLLDEAEHNVKNYSDRGGQCYLPKPKVEADNIDRGLDNS